MAKLLAGAVVYKRHRPFYSFVGQPGEIHASRKELLRQAVALIISPLRFISLLMLEGA